VPVWSVVTQRARPTAALLAAFEKVVKRFVIVETPLGSGTVDAKKPQQAEHLWGYGETGGRDRRVWK